MIEGHPNRNQIAIGDPSGYTHDRCLILCEPS